ncbi:MAG TPA: co-chaperone GroES, partial [Pseudonocardia sp.]|nr:co-chaperone GroES [Pseudonocardia sp.]
MSDPKFEIQMLHDRVMIKIVEGSGERRSTAGIVIPATAQVAKRLIWGEV